jgi:hypothetical protein
LITDSIVELMNSSELNDGVIIETKNLYSCSTKK